MSPQGWADRHAQLGVPLQLAGSARQEKLSGSPPTSEVLRKQYCEPRMHWR